MAGCCGGSCGTGGGIGGGAGDPQADYRRTLRVALVVNAVLFVVVLAAGVEARSLALRADALVFFANAATYAASLWVLGRPLERRSRASVAKGLALGALAVWVLASAVASATGSPVALPDAAVMSLAGLLALGAGVSAAALLFAARRGDATVRAVWLCSRDDAVAHAAVMLAAAGVWSTGTVWPDLVVAAGLAALSLGTAWSALRLARAGQPAPHGVPAR